MTKDFTGTRWMSIFQPSFTLFPFFFFFFVPACQSCLLAGVGGGHREQMGHGRGQNELEQMERLKNVKRCAEGPACPSKVLNWLWKELVEWIPCPPKYSTVLWCPPLDIKEEKEDAPADLKTESHFLARVHGVIVGYKTFRPPALKSCMSAYA